MPSQTAAGAGADLAADRFVNRPSAKRRGAGAVARGALMCAMAAVLWGTVGAAQAVLPPGGASPYWLAVLRLVFAVAVFGLLMLRRFIVSPSSWESGAFKRILPCALLAGAAIAGFNLFYFEGVKSCGVGIGAAAIIGSAPIWAGIMTALRTKTLPAPAWMLGVAAAAAGGLVMLTGGEFALSVPATGLLICLCAGFCYAAYTCLSKRLVERVSPLTATALTFATALLIAAPAAWSLSGAPVFTGADLLAGLWLGVFATGIAYLLFTTGLTRISAGAGVALTLLEPVTAFVLSVAAAGEPFTLAKGIGLAGILIGLAFVLSAEKH